VENPENKTGIAQGKMAMVLRVLLRLGVREKS